MPSISQDVRGAIKTALANVSANVYDHVALDNVFTAAITNADIIERNVIPAGTATLSGASTYVGNANVENAVIITSVEIFQARTAAGGQIKVAYYGYGALATKVAAGANWFNKA